MQHIEVLKFGSSVLRSASELHLAVDEIYRWWRSNCQILAVVSAFEGVTDQLIREAADLIATNTEEATATYVAQGEQRTAALLLDSLSQSGIPARVIEPHEIGLLAEGDSLDSTPVGVNLTAFGKLWDLYPILVLPGFYGVDARGNTALFGRGGSDLSALFLAAALNGSCRLLKDKWCVDKNVEQPPQSPPFPGQGAVELHITDAPYSASSQSRSERLGRHLDDAMELPPLAALASACLFISRSTFA
jgi:aspartokinase